MTITVMAASALGHWGAMGNSMCHICAWIYKYKTALKARHAAYESSTAN